ncbi:MAG TPA: hydroxysqualene dehydroxylase HpnE [Methylibium sp.]|uniref:hydroxysqualene dehydroxylase HpnE n=1 Tax=Methylibium sp. TaxID=2067992 RepID=UPI002DBBAD20|nr:hydroxysqualene dehydroxylase HpnE [Methylibium sp.]HEU4459035.1 hydroxysqualene dehydroxylase HpnE [Methylibium sp.]
MSERRIAVVGGGWAGLAAAVEATSRGAAVTLYEMAPGLGGRARRIDDGRTGPVLDNGQHILIGAYVQTLALMRCVGVEPDAVLQRMPLTLLDAQGRGLRLPPGAPLVAFVRGVLAARGWPWRDRLALLRAAWRWQRAGFRCADDLTVEGLAADLPAALRRDFIEPLCVAALNTPAGVASARVFLRVLHDALFAGPGSADLLLPRVDLGALLPDPASAWLEARGARVQRRARVMRLQREAAGRWSVAVSDGTTATFDAVVLACSSVEAARLAAEHAAPWAEQAAALPHEPIVTVLLHAPGARLAQPMLALASTAADGDAPAQFVFDLGLLRSGEPRAAGCLAFVISGAAAAIERGLDLVGAVVLAQARRQLGARLGHAPTVLRVLADKRATLRCTTGLARPPATIAPGLVAAGDHIEGPYPSTLEGAVRSGTATVGLILR